MKKIVALLLSGVMLTSLVLCGCTPKETTEEKDPTVSEEETTEAGFVAPGNRLNEDNVRKAQEYCASVDPKGNEGVSVYIDGIRGSGSTIVDDNLVFFNYTSFEGDMFSINVKRDTAEVSFSIYMMYEDTGYAVNSDFYLGGFEEYFDKVCADPGSVDPYNNSALDTHLDDLKNDFPIHFARMVAFSDEALSGIGLGLKDLGIDLGDKYRNMDPRQLTSKDVEITNEHKFENGFCTDCGMSWTEYYYEVVKEFSHFDLGNGQYSTSGQESASMISRTDQVQYSADGESYGSMYYHHSDIDNDIGTDKDDWCYIDFSNYNKKINIEVFYEYDLKKFSTGGATYRYSLNFKSEAGQLDKVFESKEAFEKCITVSMDIISKDRDNDIYDAWKTMKEEDIRQMMEADSLTYLTKDEFINRFWDLRANFFTSLDNGMVWMKTSLKDFGFNWK